MQNKFMDVTWLEKFAEKGVLWRMNYENKTGAHALLTSGKHSDSYCNCAKIVTDPAFGTEVATALIDLVSPDIGNEKPDFVVGPAYGAITFAYDVARQLGVKFAFTEIDYTEEGKMQTLKRFDIPSGARVLIIEDMMSTGGSALKTINTLEEKGIKVLPVVGFIGNWSGESTLGGRKARALFEANMNIWEAADCPLCKAGSEAVRPKSDWEKLAR
jgi:orotate phosphoribosyltransferase